MGADSIIREPCVKRLGWYVRFLTLALPAILLFATFRIYSACADIYAYTGDDGRVYLSNVPENRQYRVLVPERVEPVREAPVAAASKLSPRQVKRDKYDKMIREVAHTYGLDSALLHAVVTVESSYNPNAVSNKGASGLMQLMPGTAKRYGVENVLDPLQNLQGGAQYLRDMMQLFNGDMSLAIAAYNAGEAAVVRHSKRIPPYPETMKYVPKVMGFYQEYRTERSRHPNSLAARVAAHPLGPIGASLSREKEADVNEFSPHKNL